MMTEIRCSFLIREAELALAESGLYPDYGREMVADAKEKARSLSIALFLSLSIAE